jgi:hypothetical protein
MHVVVIVVLCGIGVLALRSNVKRYMKLVPNSVRRYLPLRGQTAV